MKKWNYHGNRLPYAAVLCHSGDTELIAPVLECMENKGIRICLLDEKNVSDNFLKKACSVIAVLTERYYVCKELMEAMIRAGSFDKEIITLRADDSEMPEILANFVYSRNSIRLSKYSPEETASKILASDALKQPTVTKEQSRSYKAMVAAMLGTAAILVAAFAILLFGPKETPVEPEPVIFASILEQYGIYEEDLEKIRSVLIMGNRVVTSEQEIQMEEYLMEALVDGEEKMILKETGETLEDGTIEDLSFLSQLPKLRSLIFVNQRAAQIPELEGNKVRKVEFYYCDFTNLEPVRGWSSLKYFTIHHCLFKDLSPLAGCPLVSGSITSNPNLRTLDGLSSDTLQYLMFDASQKTDVSALAGCTALEEVQMTGEVSDLAPLATCKNLKKLQLEFYPNVDLEFLSGLSELERLQISSQGVENLDQIRSCKKLTQLNLNLNGTNEAISLDLDCLGELPLLREIGLFGISGDLDFLESLAQNTAALDYLQVHGENIDWSGLSAISFYQSLSVSPWNGREEGILEAIRDGKFGELCLYNIRNLDITKLPEQVSVLKIDMSDIDSLVGLSCTGIQEISVGKCTRLASLEGLENCEKLSRVRVYDCFRLTDYSALEGKLLGCLDLSRQYFVPDLSKLNFSYGADISLFELFEIEDLSCLNGISDELAEKGNLSFWVSGDSLNNLNALLRFHGNNLTVTPLLEEQAADLVERGCFKQYFIEYPDEQWSSEEMEISILSLEELNTLPKAILKHATTLTLSGDECYDEMWQINWQLDRGEPYLAMEHFDTGEVIPVEPAQRELDLSILSELTGLRTLRLCGQKAADLNGIQNLENLNRLEIVNCDIPDISAIFAVDSIEHLRLEGENGISIDGIQNLRNLRELVLQKANITDLSPLKEASFSQDGFRLQLPHTWMVSDYPTELSALAAAPWYEGLDLNGYEEVEWIPYLEGKTIREAVFLSCFGENDLELLANTVGSIEVLNLSYNPQVTDLRCLLSVPGLQRVIVNGEDMEDAINSLNGIDLPFELQVWG